MCTYSKYVHAYLARHPNMTCTLCPNPQITRATHCPVIECVCVCVCVCEVTCYKSVFSKYDVLIDQVRCRVLSCTSLDWTSGQARDTGNELVSERQALINLAQYLNQLANKSQLTSLLISNKFLAIQL